MRKVILEVTSIDEDLAAKHVRNAIGSLALVIPELQHETIVIEPHDDTRGVFVGIDLALSGKQTGGYISQLVTTIRNLLLLLALPTKPDIKINVTEELEEERDT